MGGLLLTFNVGQTSFPVTSARLEAQSEARNAMNWIMKDLRQAITWNIANNNATTTYLRMNRWAWNNTTNQWDVTNATDFIEYFYNNTAQVLTRQYTDASGSVSMLQFSNITEAPFYTNLTTRQLTENALRSNRSLFVVISVEKSIRGSIIVPFTLIAEIRIRNG